MKYVIAIDAVYGGQKYYDQKLIEKKREMELFRSSKRFEVKVTHQFTEFDVEIINLMCQGLSALKIAKRMKISWWNSYHYRERIFKITRCNNVDHLIIYAMRNKILVMLFTAFLTKISVIIISHFQGYVVSSKNKLFLYISDSTLPGNIPVNSK